MRRDWAQQSMLTSGTMRVSEYNAHAWHVLQSHHSVHRSGVSLISILYKLKRLFTVTAAVEHSSRTAHPHSSRHKGCDEIVHPSIQHACTVHTVKISMTGNNVAVHT